MTDLKSSAFELVLRGIGEVGGEVKLAVVPDEMIQLLIDLVQPEAHCAQGGEEFLPGGGGFLAGHP